MANVGPQSLLTCTANAQPAILCHSIALLRILQENGLDVKSCTYALGHSLGEYSALVATQALGLGDAIRLVRLRGKTMQVENLLYRYSIHDSALNQSGVHQHECIDGT